MWFLDDLGQATPAVQASFMQLLLARAINGHQISEHVTFVAATNRRTDRAGVTGILEPVKSRFSSIVELTPDLDDWSQWALAGTEISPELVAFLRFKPELFSAFTASADLTNCPTPRTWHIAARVLGLGLPRAIEAEAVAGAVGQGAATELLAFLRLIHDLPSVDAILIDPGSAPIPTIPSALCAIATALGRKASEKTIGRIGIYAQRLLDAGRGEYSALMIRDALRRDPAIQSSQAFVRLACGPVGELLTGGDTK